MVPNRSGGTALVPRVIGPIVRREAVEVRDMRFLRANTSRRAKITLPGPFTLSQQAHNEFYADDEEMALAYAAAVNAEAHDLLAAGADIIQFDEPWMQARPEAAKRFGVRAINRAIGGLARDDDAPCLFRLCCDRRGQTRRVFRAAAACCDDRGRYFHRGCAAARGPWHPGRPRGEDHSSWGAGPGGYRGRNGRDGRRPASRRAALGVGRAPDGRAGLRHEVSASRPRDCQTGSPCGRGGTRSAGVAGLSSIREDGVVVIGAGVAGLAATRRLRAAGVPTTLIEAGARIGGRAWTTRIGGDAFDHGAAWLHDADRNPLVPLAAPADDLVDTGVAHHGRTTIDGRPVTAAEDAAYAAAGRRLEALGAGALDRADITLAAAMAPMADDPWTALLALWEGPIIAAVDADRLGLLDWRRNRLDGRNLVPRAGIGAFVTRVLATDATLGTRATRLAWSGSGVRVDTPRGSISAAAAIVTVATGALEAIRFDPPLPAELQASVAALPMGLLSKIVFPYDGGLPPETLLIDRAGCMTFNVRPLGRHHIVGFVGGRTAWGVAHDHRAFEDLARTEFARCVGLEAARVLRPAAMSTAWGTDPAYGGAYAYAGPGASLSRATLAQAFPAERLLFAGEAARTDGLAGTVAGAYLSGSDAADRLLSSGRVGPSVLGSRSEAVEAPSAER